MANGQKKYILGGGGIGRGDEIEQAFKNGWIGQRQYGWLKELNEAAWEATHNRGLGVTGVTPESVQLYGNEAFVSIFQHDANIVIQQEINAGRLFTETYSFAETEALSRSGYNLDKLHPQTQGMYDYQFFHQERWAHVSEKTVKAYIESQKGK